ncbi:MAG TPA: class I SAM-dependent methyltransferase [Gaiellaceae bacterium]|nr:class I SAM-dependent methyltransferase [Gaiellaceae bacterium]
MSTDRFGENVAARYDDPTDPANAPERIAPVVDFLAGLAGDGAALELAIGTGRIAVPLAGRGVPVKGIELSEAMLARLRAKTPVVEAVAGDMTATRVEGTFRLVYLVFNTIENLTTQAAQVACFRNAAAHLEPGGAFVIEVEVPDLRRLPPGQTVVPFAVGEDRLGFDEYDVARQGLVSHHFRREDGAWRQASIPFRYVWPAELDLMAELAGLRLADRFADWDRSPFTAESRKHVSLWTKP